MYHLPRARARASNSGLPLKTVWRSLAAATAIPRRGQLWLIAGGPGVGKSAVALSLAVKCEGSGIYFSADSDVGDQYARSAAILTDQPFSEIQGDLSRGKFEEYDEVLASLNRIRFDFDAGPSLSDIEETVRCYALIHGRFPEIIFVDNLGNVDEESGTDGFVALENILAFLQDLARQTRAFVCVLHHLTGEYEDGNRPAPLSGLRGKVGKLPNVVLTLYRHDDEDGFGPEKLGVAIVKNRSGKANAAGKLVVLLDLDLERMSITDIEQTESVWGDAA